MDARIVERVAGNQHTFVFAAAQAQATIDVYILAHKVELTAAVLGRTHIWHSRVKVKVKADTFVVKDCIGAAHAMETIDHQCPALFILCKIERQLLRRQAAAAIVERCNLETVENRIDVYEAQTKPLVDYYENAGNIAHIDGATGLDNVFADIVKALGE